MAINVLSPEPPLNGYDIQKLMKHCSVCVQPNYFGLWNLILSRGSFITLLKCSDVKTKFHIIIGLLVWCSLLIREQNFECILIYMHIETAIWTESLRCLIKWMARIHYVIMIHFVFSMVSTTCDAFNTKIDTSFRIECRDVAYDLAPLIKNYLLCELLEYDRMSITFQWSYLHVMFSSVLRFLCLCHHYSPWLMFLHYLKVKENPVKLPMAIINSYYSLLSKFKWISNTIKIALWTEIQSNWHITEKDYSPMFD